MKTWKTLTLFFIPAFILVAVLSFDKLSSEKVQPPAGYCNNPPLVTNCTYCHSGSPPIHDSTAFTVYIGPDTSHLTILTSGVTTYTANQTYFMRVQATHIRPVYGFELTADDALGNGEDVGTFMVLNPVNTALAATGSIGNYISHHNANSNNQWTFQWTAPSSDVGPITFYWAGNDANGFDTTPPIGDSIYIAQKTIMANPSAINYISEELSGVKIFPTVTSGNLQLEFNLVKNGSITGQLVSVNGQIVQSVLHESLTAGSYKRSIDVANLAPGIYLLKLQMEDGFWAQKFVKE